MKIKSKGRTVPVPHTEYKIGLTSSRMTSGARWRRRCNNLASQFLSGIAAPASAAADKSNCGLSFRRAGDSRGGRLEVRNELPVGAAFFGFVFDAKERGRVHGYEQVCAIGEP